MAGDFHKGGAIRVAADAFGAPNPDWVQSLAQLYSSLSRSGRHVVVAEGAVAAESMKSATIAAMYAIASSATFSAEDSSVWDAIPFITPSMFE